MKRNFLPAFAFALLVSGAFHSPVQAKVVSGAIFTTNVFGIVVNGNQYNSKCDVYLDGGPGPNAPASAAGLPDGDYYFQVTDPSGQTLLSLDPVEDRKFQVSGGVIVANLGTHATGIDQDHGAQGAITIRLGNGDCSTDYADTPNNGGVYKAWATPVTDYVDESMCGNGCFHGFLPAKSKTDNFKVDATQLTFCLTVLKEFLDDQGVYQPYAGWTMSVTDDELDVTNSLPTDKQNGAARFCGLLPDHQYTVREEIKPETHLEQLWVNGMQLPAQEMYSFMWKPGDPEPFVLFRNAPGEAEPPPSIN
jgi:hypothetical protein